MVWRLIGIGFVAIGLQAGDAEASQPRRRAKAPNFHGIAYVQQVPRAAWAHRRVVYSREFEALYTGPEDAVAYRRARRNPKSFLDALLEVPNPDTRPILFDLGIPAVDDVPPIALLYGLQRHPRHEFFRRFGPRR
ncbi:hypothetical protein [Rhodomicrobium vannielii]|nr:hypothetical protein [Rhodomicrobium vannielii]